LISSDQDNGVKIQAVYLRGGWVGKLKGESATLLQCESGLRQEYLFNFNSH